MDIQWRSSDSQAFASYGSENRPAWWTPAWRTPCWCARGSMRAHVLAQRREWIPASPRTSHARGAGHSAQVGHPTSHFDWFVYSQECTLRHPHRSLDQAVGHVWSGTMAAGCQICNLAARQARESPADQGNTHASLGCFRCVLGAGGCHVESCTSRSLRVESSRWKWRQLGPPGAGVQPCRLRAQVCAWVEAVKFFVWFGSAV